MMQHQIRQIMTEEVVTVGPLSSLTRVKEIFETHWIHHIPVVEDDGVVVGIISKLDYHLLLSHFTIFNIERADRSNEKFLAALIVREVMSKQVATIRPDDSIRIALEIFLENQYRALPVTEGGKLVGIVTTYDILRYCAAKEELKRLPA